MSHTKYHLNSKLLLLCLFLSLLLLGLFVNHRIHAANSPLKIGVVSNNAPLSSKTAKHELTGANVTVAKQLAQQFKRPIKLVAVNDQAELKTQLRHGQLDLGLGDFPAAKKQHSWQTTQPVFYLDNVLFRRADGKQKSLVKLTGKKVGKLRVGPQTTLLKELGLKAKNYPSSAALFDALQKKQIRAAILTDPQYSNYLQQHPELVQVKDHTDPDQKKQVIKRFNDPQIIGQTIRVLTYGHRRLNRQAVQALAQLKQSGKLNDISRHFFGKDLTLE